MADLTAQLREQVQQAKSEQIPLQIIGANSKSHLGRSVIAMPINTAEHTGIISYSPTELVIRARSGTKISDLNLALAEHDQRLPFDPPQYQMQGTIGGTVATNQSGPARPWFGAVKDSLLGLGLINGYAQEMNFGGQVMKNVAGFDITRLQCGAMGALGLITEVSIKVLPMFKASLTLVFEIDQAAALEIMPAWSNQNLPITGICHWQGMQYVRLQGGQSGVDEAASGLLKQLPGALLDATLAKEFWRQVREQELLQPHGSQVLWRWTGAADASAEALPGAQLINWAGAERWVLAEDRPADNMALVQYQGGDRQAEVNPAMDTHNRALQIRLKHAFDPHGLFNVGRSYAWL
ncbi:MAG: glycolate oxidase subunit GlcE [Gammaproteobacteria bacterium]|nr:glycolate oxidase subunit GlcE [Gammaproteobacteria bacterium]